MTGDELLIVEANENHRDGMKKLFEGGGYVCTAVATANDARERAKTKFFPAAIISLDVEGQSDGLDLARFVRERSPQTAVFILAGRRSFEATVDALRMGVTDVVLKSPDQVKYLKQKVDLACEKFRSAGSDDTPILKDVLTVLDLAFETMLVLARTVYHDISVGAAASYRPRVLFVESDQATVMALSQLVQQKSWEIGAAMSGGEALDKAGEATFDLIVVRDELIDLPGPMVLKSLQARRVEAHGLLYSLPGPEGRVEHLVAGRTTDVVRPFTRLEKLIDECDNVVGRLAATQRDRRVLAAFRSDHEAYFRRYAELRIRIGRLTGS